MDDIEKRRSDRWNFLFIAGMWFQDLFNYDFRRTRSKCIIPYATQEGEISFCAYNTGVGWRNIIEKMHMTASLTKWYEENGRHEIFAGGKHVPLDTKEHQLVLRNEIVTIEEQHDLDRLGIAKNAGEEKTRARDAKLKQAQENARMAKLYRQHVLKEEAGPELVQMRQRRTLTPRPYPLPKPVASKSARKSAASGTKSREFQVISHQLKSSAAKRRGFLFVERSCTPSAGPSGCQSPGQTANPDRPPHGALIGFVCLP